MDSVYTNSVYLLCTLFRIGCRYVSVCVCVGRFAAVATTTTWFQNMCTDWINFSFDSNKIPSRNAKIDQNYCKTFDQMKYTDFVSECDREFKYACKKELSLRIFVENWLNGIHCYSKFVFWLWIILVTMDIVVWLLLKYISIFCRLMSSRMAYHNSATQLFWYPMLGYSLGIFIRW